MKSGVKMKLIIYVPWIFHYNVFFLIRKFVLINMKVAWIIQTFTCFEFLIALALKATKQKEAECQSVNKGKRFICRQLQGRCLMQQWKQQKNGQHESREEGVMKLSEWLIFPVNKEHTLNEIAVHLGAIFASYM